MRRYAINKPACFCAVTALIIPTSYARAGKPVELASAGSEQQLAVVRETVPTKVPQGFEGISTAIDTLFDTYYLGKKIGSFRATEDNGKLTFSNPEMVAEALGNLVSRDAVLQLLSHPLDLNEKYRCFPGQTTNCGILPPGQEGAIVDPESFSVELFFSPADVVRKTASAYQPLGPAMSGPSLIQRAAVSLATDTGHSGGFRYGGTFDTAASIGRTAFIAQTLADDNQGVRINNAVVQHVWSDRILRAGLFEDLSTSLLTSYRIIGAEYGSFYPASAYGASIATPVQIVLPRDADVELRRNGVLVAVRHYDAGLQLIDTSALPEGSYPLELVARVSGSIILQQTQSFTKAGGLPLPGKTEFAVRGGLYAQESNDFDPDVAGSGQSLFPHAHGYVAGARVARRIGQATGASLELLSIAGKEYAEGSITTYRGRLQALATLAASSDGSYAGLVTGSTSIGRVQLSGTLRYIHSSDDDFDLADFRDGKYRAFLRSEKSIYGSAQVPLFGGSVSLSGGYSRSSGIPDQYSAEARYTRSVVLLHRSALLSAFASTSNSDTRVGFTLSFNFGIGRRTTASVSGGGEVVPNSTGATREGFSPILNATVSRRNTLLGADMVNQAGVSTDADSDRGFVSSDISSRFGELDTTAQYQRTRGSEDIGSIFANGTTGFAIGGGAFKFGLAQPGDAVILSDIAKPGDGTDAHAPTGSGYRIRIDSQAGNLIKPGQVSATGVTAYAEHNIELEPENAPPYDIDLKTSHVTTYPGNVVRLHYTATHSYTLFGRIVDGTGAPVGDAVVSAGDDIVATGASGYFTITAPGTSKLLVRKADGSPCGSANVATLIGTKPSLRLNRVGNVVCTTSAVKPDGKAAPVDVPAKTPTGQANGASHKRADDVQTSENATRQINLQELARVVATAKRQLARYDLAHDGGGDAISPLGAVVARTFVRLSINPVDTLA